MIGSPKFLVALLTVTGVVMLLSALGIYLSTGPAKSDAADRGIHDASYLGGTYTGVHTLNNRLQSQPIHLPLSNCRDTQK